MGLTAAEAMFVVQLMAFKWTEDAPFPSYMTLAKPPHGETYWAGF